MRPLRLPLTALVAAAVLGACSAGNITGPTPKVAEPLLDGSSCRGWLASSGRCDDGSNALFAKRSDQLSGGVVAATECRGWLASSGRCKPD